MEYRLEKEYKTSLSSVILEKDNYKNEEDRNITILLVEDTKINQILISELVRKNGWNCIIAQDGIEALNILKNIKCNLILMDIVMPGMNGIEVTKIIKQNDDWKCIPIIALTSCELKENKKKFLNAGMEDCLTKPINDKELYYMMVKYLNLLEVGEKDKIYWKYIAGIQKLEKMLDGNKKMVIELGEKVINLFYEYKTEKTFEIIQDGKINRVRNEVHKVKGAALNFELIEIKELLEEICLYADIGDVERTFKIIEQIENKINEFWEVLNIYREKTNIL